MIRTFAPPRVILSEAYAESTAPLPAMLRVSVAGAVPRSCERKAGRKIPDIRDSSFHSE